MVKRVIKQIRTAIFLSTILILLMLAQNLTLAQNGSNGTIKPLSEKDGKKILKRGDIKKLPQPLKDTIAFMATVPHTFVPSTIFNEFSFTGKDALLFQYYLLDLKDFEPTAFTTRVPGFTDRFTTGAVRVIISPEPGRPMDPNDVRAKIDLYLDMVAVLTVNNESGWYEAWLMHDIKVPLVASARADGSAQFGLITDQDAQALKRMGNGNNIPGNLFTMDGNAPRFPSAKDHFPDEQSNLVPVQISAGVFNAVGETDVHGYRMFTNNHNWSYPVYELPFTGGLPKVFPNNKIGDVSSLIPGSIPGGQNNDVSIYGDDPKNPRDADNFASTDAKEFRNRFIPSGLAREILLDAFVRIASFQPNEKDMTKRIVLAYVKEVARIDQNGDGVISFDEADVNATSDGLSNLRLYIPITAYNRFAVTREINDGLLAPRFAPSQRAYIASGTQVLLSTPVVAALEDQEGEGTE